MAGNFTDDRPIFLQIAELLEDAILSGAYGEEEQVPSITEFSVAYKINPATALKGVSILADEGLLYKKRGLGMFVAAGAKGKLASRRKDRFFRDFVLPTAREAKRLEITESELIEMTERGFKQNGD